MADKRLVACNPNNPNAARVVNRHDTKPFTAGTGFVFFILFTTLAEQHIHHNPVLATMFLVFILLIAGIGGTVYVRNMLGKDAYSRLKASGDFIVLDKVFIGAFDAVSEDEGLVLNKEERKQALTGQFGYEAARETRAAVSSYNQLAKQPGQEEAQRREEAKIRARVRQAVQLIATEREALHPAQDDQAAIEPGEGAYVAGIGDEDIDRELNQMKPHQPEPAQAEPAREPHN